MKDKIKIEYKELEKENTERLIQMKKELELHIMKSYVKGYEKGRNIKQEKRNLSRIKQILNER